MAFVHGLRRWTWGVVLAVLAVEVILAGEPPAAPEPDPDRAEAVEAGGATGDDEEGRVPVVVVTATRRKTLLSETPDVVQVVSRREIEELNPRSTGELLEHVTGTTIETGTGSGFPNRSIIGLNGLPARYTLVLVDGVRLLSEHIHTGQNLELIPPESIERIEIIRGAAAAQYGSDAIGGVVNIITRKAGPTPELSLGTSAGHYDTYTGDFGLLQPLSDRVRVSAFLNREQSHGVPIKAPRHRVGEMGYQSCRALARLDADLSETTSVFGWVHRVDRTMDWFGEDADSDLTTAVAGTRTELRPSLDLFAQFSYSRWEAEVSEEKNELFHPQTHLRWSISPAHTLTGGVELRRQEFSRSAAGDTPAQDTYGAFLQHEWWPCDQLTVMTALRYESVEDIDSVLSPKVSLVYAPDLPLILRASVARGFRAPSPQELYEEGYGHGGRALRFGNPDLDPEYSTTYSLGAELFPGQPLQVMLYGHYSDVDDMIVPVFEGPWAKDPTKDVWRRTNVAEARVCGAEIKARYAFSRHCRLEGGYSYTDSEDEGTGRQLPYDPGSSAFLKAIVGGDLSPQWRWSSFLALRAVFGRSAWSWKPAPGAPPADPSGLTTDLDDYQKLDAGASLHYRERYEFYVTVDNILGQDIEHLDDVFTVIDGEPVITAGLKATW